MGRSHNQEILSSNLPDTGTFFNLPDAGTFFLKVPGSIPVCGFLILGLTSNIIFIVLSL